MAKPSSEASPPEVAARDLEDAIGYQKAHPEDFPEWDGQHIAALGESAGGSVVLDAVADANARGSQDKPQVSATWSGAMEMGSMDTTPDDGFFSADSCDHARGYVTPMQTEPDYMVNCWFASDRYMGSANEDGTPRCGLSWGSGGPVPDPYMTHISQDSSDGLRERADLQEWVIAHPEILDPDVLIVTFEFDRWMASAVRGPARTSPHRAARAPEGVRHALADRGGAPTGRRRHDGAHHVGHHRAAVPEGGAAAEAGGDD